MAQSGADADEMKRPSAGDAHEVAGMETAIFVVAAVVRGGVEGEVGVREAMKVTAAAGVQGVAVVVAAAEAVADRVAGTGGLFVVVDH